MESQPDRGDDDPPTDSDPLDDLEPADHIPEPPVCVRCAGRGGEMSYDDLKLLALDCEKKIQELVKQNTELSSIINTHQCPVADPAVTTVTTVTTTDAGATANNNNAPVSKEPKAVLESQIEELNAAIAALKEENEMLRANEDRLMDMVGVQGREQEKKESEEVVKMRAKVKEQADMLAKQKMVIQTLRSQMERLSKKK